MRSFLFGYTVDGCFTQYKEVKAGSLYVAERAFKAYLKNMFPWASKTNIDWWFEE